MVSHLGSLSHDMLNSGWTWKVQMVWILSAGARGMKASRSRWAHLCGRSVWLMNQLFCSRFLSALVLSGRFWHLERAGGRPATPLPEPSPGRDPAVYSHGLSPWRQSLACWLWNENKSAAQTARSRECNVKHNARSGWAGDPAGQNQNHKHIPPGISLQAFSPRWCRLFTDVMFLN